MAVVTGLSQIDRHLAGLTPDGVALFGQRHPLADREVGVGEGGVEFGEMPAELSVVLFEMVNRVCVLGLPIDFGERPFFSFR